MTNSAPVAGAQDGAAGRRAPDAAQPLILVSTAVPTRADRLFAVAFALALVCALVATAPFARIRLPGTETLVPAYFVAVLINQSITAALLFGLFAVDRSRRILVLACGYLFAGLMIVPWALSFPGAFPAFGLDAGTQVTATIAAINRLGFPLCILAYALSRERHGFGGDGPAAVPIAAGIAAVVLVVGTVSGLVLFTDLPLPAFMADIHTPSPLWRYVPPVSLGICAIAFVALRARLASVLDLWLLVVLVSLTIEVVLLAYLSEGVRLSLGWWAGRVYGLVAASTMLIVLLSGMTALYARLARSVLAEQRARESRLAVIEAISASIAHEIRQPLSSIELSAAAGLRWLRRDLPDYGEVEAALTRIEEVGVRASRVVDSIRTTFETGKAPRAEVDVNAAIREVVARYREEAVIERVVVRSELAEPSPRVLIDPLQLQLVVANLVKNAIEAMRMAPGGPRLLTLASVRDGGFVVVRAADTGTGLSPGDRERIFSAFFSTKADGMGVGLMFCRSVVETNGGRIWITDNAPRGAVFHLSLPAAEGRAGDQ